MSLRDVKRAILSNIGGDGVSGSELFSKLHGYDLRIVVKAIRELEEEGRIYLEDTVPSSPLDFLSSPRALSLWLVLSTTAATLALVLSGVTRPPLVYARYVLGSVYVLFTPGYSLIQALYFRREELEDLERLALSIGLSLALVPLVGLVLNYTPFGIRLIPVTVSLALLSVGLITLAMLRRYRYLRAVEEA